MSFAVKMTTGTQGDRCQFDQVASAIQEHRLGWEVHTSCERTESTRCQPASPRSATRPLVPSDEPEVSNTATPNKSVVTINVLVIAPADRDNMLHFTIATHRRS
jgi:hypothetical protein